MNKVNERIRRRMIFVVILLSLIGFSRAQSLTLLDTYITYSAGSSSINFTLTSALGNNVSPTNAWLGLGFNTAASMSGAGVVACVYSSGSGSVQSYVNNGYTSTQVSLLNPTLGISNSYVSVANGNFTCGFTRDYSASNSNYFNLTANPQPYLLVAYGTPVLRAVTYHAARVASSSTVALIGSNTVTTTTTAPSSSNSSSNSLSSGIFTIAWSASTSSVTFTLTTQTSSSSNIYTAIGFSTDTSMGSDDVVACIYSTSLKGVSRYYNVGKSPVKQAAIDGISSVAVSIENGAIKCSFVRAINLTSDSNFYSLTNSYYLLSAYGSTDDLGNIQYHSTKISSASSINFLSCSSSSGGVNVDSRLKAHGALMVIAWMLCASAGIMIARYYKFIFPNKKPFNLAMWFVIHRPLMMFVPLLSVIAFIVVLAALGWQWVSTSNTKSLAHSIIGIITIGFSIIQVLIAFFRCDKDHPQRFIFNYVHRCLGITSFILATIAILIGVTIDKMELGNECVGIMIAWVIWIVVLPLTVELVQFIWKRKSRSSATDLDQNKDVVVNNVDDKKVNRIKSVILIIHLIVAFALTLALIILICTSSSASVSVICKN